MAPRRAAQAIPPVGRAAGDCRPEPGREAAMGAAGSSDPVASSPRAAGERVVRHPAPGGRPERLAFPAAVAPRGPRAFPAAAAELERLAFPAAAATAGRLAIREAAGSRQRRVLAAAPPVVPAEVAAADRADPWRRPTARRVRPVPNARAGCAVRTASVATSRATGSVSRATPPPAREPAWRPRRPVRLAQVLALAVATATERTERRAPTQAPRRHAEPPRPVPAVFP